MIKKEQIARLAGPRSYSRGEQIYRQDKILHFSAAEDDYAEYDEIAAVVAGSGGSLYEVTMSVNLLDDEIEDIDCECPAFASYSGICKHCVAVLLKYMEDSSDTWQQELCSENGEGIFQGSRFKIQKGIKPETTPVLGQLLRKRQEERMLPLLEQDTYGQVHLEPTMFCEADSVYVSFKIGITQMYVVKDVFELINHIDRRDRYRYGKKLEFLHSMEVFDEASRKLVKFLEQWTRENAEQYRNDSYYGYYSYGRSAPKSREMYLSGDALENYLNLMRGQSFQAQVMGMPYTTWQISEKPLSKKLKLTGNKDGVNLEVSLYPGYKLNRSTVFFHDGSVYIEQITENEVLREFAGAMTQLQSGNAFIGNADIPAFCRELLPALEEHYEC